MDGTALDAERPRAFVDFENGMLFFPDLRPFAPRLGGPAASRSTARVSAACCSRRDSLVGPAADSANGAEPARSTTSTTPQRDIDAQLLHRRRVHRRAARGGEIMLGRGNILEGSEVVTVNGQPLVRDRDYTIDYDLGRVTLKRQLGPADQLNIDYSYAPLFQQAGRTLVGSAFRLEGRDKQPRRRVHVREQGRAGPAAAARRGAVAQPDRRPQHRVDASSPTG